MLDELGYDVFKDCEELKSVTFPRDYGETKLPVSTFAGCSKLEFIATSNPNFNLVDDTEVNYTIQDLKAILPEGFYLRGLENSPLHMPLRFVILTEQRTYMN